MSYAVKIGTTEARWIHDAPTPDGCVRYDGDITDDLVWGDDIQNLRPRNAAESLTHAKASAVDANRAECSARIYAKWPAGAQSSASLGVYPQAVVDQMRADIAALIQAENAAADAIEAATTVAEVEAIQPNWPVI